VSSPIIRVATDIVQNANPWRAPTLPQQIGGLALQNAREIYRILFRAVSETLLTIAADPKHLGAATGFLAVLHTWGQNLHLHPHPHWVAPGGGIGPDGSSWAGCRASFFLPVRVLSRLFRNKFLSYLREAFREGKLQFHGEMAPLALPAGFVRIRQFGFLANRARGKKLEHCRALLCEPPTTANSTVTIIDRE
jgi:Putative transposase